MLFSLINEQNSLFLTEKPFPLFFSAQRKEPFVSLCKEKEDDISRYRLPGRIYNNFTTVHETSDYTRTHERVQI